MQREYFLRCKFYMEMALKKSLNDVILEMGRKRRKRWKR